MANTFKNQVETGVGTSLATIYTAPADTTTTVIGLSCSNITAGNVTVDVILEDVSAVKSVYLVKSAPIPVGSALVVVGGDQKVILETGDKIKVQASDATSVDFVMSYMEITS